MEITQEEISKEKKILSKTHNLVQKRINELSNTINVELEDIKEFKKLSWQDINPEERVDVARISLKMKKKILFIIFICL